MDMATVIGSVAAVCTTVSYFPQLRKCWKTGSAGDLSFATFSILATGVALWTLYGVLLGDLVIIVANFVSLCLLLGILGCKLREARARRNGLTGNAPDGRERDLRRV